MSDVILPQEPVRGWQASAAAVELVHTHTLAPHPEGGWFRRTWTAPAQVETVNGPRATASGIIFLLDRDQEAAWHKVISDELWLWHGPGALEIHLGGSAEQPEEDTSPTVLGDPSNGGIVQFLVPAGTWQRTFARGDIALATCIVSPEFSFEDWQLAQSTSQ